MQLHARFWRGTIASRKRNIHALRVWKHNLRVDRHWWTGRLKYLRGASAMKQRELQALQKQEQEQTASIDLWFEGLPQEERSYLKWYQEVMTADAASTNSIPSSSCMGCQPSNVYVRWHPAIAQRLVDEFPRSRCQRLARSI